MTEFFYCPRFCFWNQSSRYRSFFNNIFSPRIYDHWGHLVIFFKIKKSILHAFFKWNKFIETYQEMVQVSNTSCIIKINRENMNRDKILTQIFCMGGQHIKFFNLPVGNGNTARGYTTAVDINIPSRLGKVTKNFVGGIWVIQTQR